jgi:hypothetical protein
VDASNAKTPATWKVNGRRDCGEQLAGRLIQSNSAHPPLVQLLIVSEIRAGRYAARLDGETEILCKSYQPFCDGARRLIARGHDPASLLVMRHQGSTTDALRARLSVAAKLTVRETQTEPPRLCRWKPWQSRAVSPPVRLNGRAGVETRRPSLARMGA